MYSEVFLSHHFEWVFYHVSHLYGLSPVCILRCFKSPFWVSVLPRFTFIRLISSVCSEVFLSHHFKWVFYHVSHLYGLSPVCILRCFKSPFWVSVLPRFTFIRLISSVCSEVFLSHHFKWVFYHVSHLYGLSPVCVLRCFKSPFWVSVLPRFTFIWLISSVYSEVF